MADEEEAAFSQKAEALLEARLAAIIFKTIEDNPHLALEILRARYPENWPVLARKKVKFLWFSF